MLGVLARKHKSPHEVPDMPDMNTIREAVKRLTRGEINREQYDAILGGLPLPERVFVPTTAPLVGAEAIAKAFGGKVVEDDHLQDATKMVWRPQRFTWNEEQKGYAVWLVNTSRIGNRGEFDGSPERQVAGMLGQVIVADAFKLPTADGTGQGNTGDSHRY